MGKSEMPEHEIKDVPLASMKPAAYNPRRIGAGAKHGLTKSLERFGVVQPIVWNKRTGNIVGGHQRFTVLVEKGVVKTKAVVVDLDERDEKALNLTLNNLEIQGEFTAAALDILDELEMDAPDLVDDTLLNELKRSLAHEDLSLEGEAEAEAPPADVPNPVPAMELQPFEHYDYLLVVANNTHDWNWLCERLGIEKVDSSTPGLTTGKRRIGLGRAVWASKLVELLKAKGGGS